MKRNTVITVGIICIAAMCIFGVAQAQNRIPEAVVLKARLYDALQVVCNGDPLEALMGQTEAIKRAQGIVSASGDSLLVEQFKQAGFDVTFTRKE